MDEHTLEIITGLIDRIEALEASVQKHVAVIATQDDIIKRWEKVHLPTQEEAIANIEWRKEQRQTILPSREALYIRIWGVERFERVWRKSAEPFLKDAGL
jgi:sulfite reductase beta subunit-like hemoprotein